MGAGGVYEKDVNLAVALKLKPLLEAKGIRVILTREGDEGLYRETDSNKKKADLKERCRIIEESGAEFVVSIHQNSYGSEEVHGSQVFYYKGSAKGKNLAKYTRQDLNRIADIINTMPRKVLGYRSAAEAWELELKNLHSPSLRYLF